MGSNKMVKPGQVIINAQHVQESKMSHTIRLYTYSINNYWPKMTEKCEYFEYASSKTPDEDLKYYNFSP